MSRAWRIDRRMTSSTKSSIGTAHCLGDNLDEAGQRRRR
jgi:hypothetical protein